MLVASGNTNEIAWAYALLASVVFVYIGALDHDYPNIVSVCVHSGVECWDELSEGTVRSHVSVSPDRGHGRALSRFGEFRLIGGGENYLVRSFLLPLHPPDGPRDQKRRCCSNNQQ